MDKINTIRSISSVLLAEEAMKRGIKVEHINPYRYDEAFLELDYNGHREILIGQRSSKTSLEAYWILENKDLTRIFLQKSGISVAEGRVFRKEDAKEAPGYCENIGYPVVAKKIAGSHGDMVFAGINNSKDLDEALSAIFQNNNLVLIEKKFDGKEFRILATKRKVIGVINREPANVTGDGIHRIGELVELKNKDPKRGDEHDSFLTKIKIDETAIKKLSEQGLAPDSIPANGVKIYLRNNSNLSTGGDSVDYTDIIHPGYKKIAVQAVRAIPGLAYSGIDLMSRDISEKPAPGSYIIIEMNSSPGLRSHHEPYSGKSRNAAREIVDMLFPETKK